MEWNVRHRLDDRGQLAQPDGPVQAPAPSFGCRDVAHQHTHACNPGGDPHGAADTQVAESPECREGANGRSHPLVPVQEADAVARIPVGTAGWVDPPLRIA